MQENLNHRGQGKPKPDIPALSSEIARGRRNPCT